VTGEPFFANRYQLPQAGDWFKAESAVKKENAVLIPEEVCCRIVARLGYNTGDFFYLTGPDNQ